MTVGIIATNIVPDISTKIIFIPLLLLWVSHAYISSDESFINTFFKPSLRTYSIYVWLILYLIIFLTGYSTSIGVYLLNFTRIGFTILMFNYYIELNDYKVVNRLMIISMILICFVCITSLQVLATNKDAARLLATGREEITQNLHGIIGGYAFIYSLIFICIVILGCFVEGIIKKNKVLWILILGLLVSTIFKASFMIALILLITISLLTVFKVNKFSHFMFLIIFIIIVIKILSPFISHGLILLSSTANSQSMSMRINELNQFLLYGNAKGTIDMSARFDLYIVSIKSFLSNPLLGVGGFYGYDTSIIGGHSAFIDEIARYGILGSAPLFIGLFSNMRYVYIKFDQKQKKIYMKCLVTFLVLGFINTLLFVPLVMVVFFVTPGLIMYLKDHNDLNQVENKY